MTIRERIEYLRSKKGWTQAELARRAKIGQSTLNGYETGARPTKDMSIDVAKRLALALGVTVDYLIGVYEEENGERKLAAMALAGN